MRFFATTSTKYSLVSDPNKRPIRWGSTFVLTSRESPRSRSSRARKGTSMIVMSMRWDGVTKQQYDECREKVGWEKNAPKGGSFHVAWFEKNALRVVDVWDSAASF